MTPYYQDEYATLYLGDCREVLPTLPAASVGNVVTDPPYPIKFLPLYAPCWLACDVILRDGGYAFVMCGQYKLPVVLNSFPAGWEYLWCGCFSKPHMAVSIWPRGISSAWKPLLIYGKNAKGFKPWKYDVIKPQDKWTSNKRGHEWGQDVSEFATVIKRFDLGGPILDPFMGAGTTLRAAKDQGRKSIGIEVEERYCEIAANRLSQGVLEYGDRA